MIATISIQILGAGVFFLLSPLPLKLKAQAVSCFPAGGPRSDCGESQPRDAMSEETLQSIQDLKAQVKELGSISVPADIIGVLVGEEENRDSSTSDESWHGKCTRYSCTTQRGTETRAPRSRE